MARLSSSFGRNIRLSIAAVGTLVLLASCDARSPESAERAHQERDAQLAETLRNEATNDPQNPFAAAQMLTEDSMQAATAGTIDQTWLEIMIEHQEGAARFADIVLRSGSSGGVSNEAAKISKESHGRIEKLKGLRKSSLGGDGDSGDALRPAISSTFQNMATAIGASPAETWALKMIAYDRGAVSLAGIEATRGKDERVRQIAREMALELANEADRLERMRHALR